LPTTLFERLIYTKTFANRKVLEPGYTAWIHTLGSLKTSSPGGFETVACAGDWVDLKISLTLSVAGL